MADQCGVGCPIGGTGGSKSNPTRCVTTGPVDPGGKNTAYCHHGRCTDGHTLGHGTGAGGGNINSKTYDPQAEVKAVQRAKATANAAVAAAKKQVSGFKHQLLSLVADVIGLTDAYNCFTKGDVMGCVNTARDGPAMGRGAGCRPQDGVVRAGREGAGDGRTGRRFGRLPVIRGQSKVSNLLGSSLRPWP
ncbi:hypothetical protein [Streptomyces canus]|uniref:hypothetical protein n=1 Tax=Streptomyces canus TaxID=58343 RepID=UPI0038021B0A